MVPPVAVRLRRDFGAVLSLIRAHAVLHQAARPKDEQGRIVASMDDYGSVRGLIVDLVSAGVGATVKPEVRATVEMVRRLVSDGEQYVTRKQLQIELKLDRSSVTRRCQAAIEDGYLKNLEERSRQPARYVIGDDMPEDLTILPTVEELRGDVTPESQERQERQTAPVQEKDEWGLTDEEAKRVKRLVYEGMSEDFAREAVLSRRKGDGGQETAA